jgi:hypothetical protein
VAAQFDGKECMRRGPIYREKEGEDHVHPKESIPNRFSGVRVGFHLWVRFDVGGGGGFPSLPLLLTRGDRKRPWGGVLARHESAESGVGKSANCRGAKHDSADADKQCGSRALQSGQPRLILIQRPS